MTSCLCAASRHLPTPAPTPSPLPLPAWRMQLKFVSGCLLNYMKLTLKLNQTLKWEFHQAL